MTTSVMKRFNFETGFIPYWNTLWFFFAIGLAGRAVEPLVGYRSVGFIFLLGVMTVGLIGSRAVAVFAAALSALAWNFFFIPPRFTFVIERADDALMCATYFVAALTIGYVTTKVRRSETELEIRDERTDTLFELLLKISSRLGPSRELNDVTEQIGRLLKTKTALLLVHEDGSLGGREIGQLKLSETEIESAKAGVTDSMKSGVVQLMGIKGLVGLLVIEDKQALEGNRKLIGAVVRPLSMALERRLDDSRHARLQAIETNDRKYTEISDALVAERRAVTSKHQSRPGLRDFLASEILTSAKRVDAMIPSLLESAVSVRERFGTLNPADVVYATLQRLSTVAVHDRIRLDIGPDLPEVSGDFELLIQAFSNLVAALTTMPLRGSIDVSCRSREGKIFFVFEHSDGKWTEEMSKSAPIEVARKIFDVHSGEMRISNRDEAGVRIAVSLPAHS